jgi:hypothetical protein
VHPFRPADFLSSGTYGKSLRLIIDYGTLTPQTLVGLASTEATRGFFNSAHSFTTDKMLSTFLLQKPYNMKQGVG